MDFIEEDKLYMEMVLQTGKTMLAEGENAFVFFEFLGMNDFDNAYKMLSLSQKEMYTVEEFKKIATEGPQSSLPS